MKDRFYILFIILIGIILYGSTIKGVFGNPDTQKIIDQHLTTPPGVLELSPEQGRYGHVLSLAETGHYDFSKEFVEFNSPDSAYFNGKFFSFFAPGISYLVLPAFQLGWTFNLAQLFSFAFIAVISIISLIFLFYIGQHILKLPRWLSLFAVMVFGFASTSWSYAATLYQHPVTAYCIVSSFYAIWRYKQEDKYSWYWAILVWFNYGLGIFIDYPNAVLLLPLMVYFLISSMKLIHSLGKIKFSIRNSFYSTSIIFILLILLHGLHNQTYFGSWKKISGGLLSYKTYVSLQETNNVNIESAIKQEEQKKNVGTFFQEKNIPQGLFTLLISDDRGLLFYSPIFILALFAIFKLRSGINLEHTTLITLLVVNIFFYSGWGDPHGGWAFGPRYLIPSLPILSLYVALWIYNKGMGIGNKILAFFLFAYSSAISLVGAVTTNAIRQKFKVEGFTDITYNFLFNIDFLKKNQTASFIYNNFFIDHISLVHYFFAIYGLLLITVIFVLFLLPHYAGIMGTGDNGDSPQ